ncbi:hypothetical protein TcWFU_003297 [Taenia crassiceps]|uniref:Uncharacterized protein n=1 Tax=Taenia crassiceps TaxID=6207 RepID=A0ABR4Q6E5_9CEST
MAKLDSGEEHSQWVGQVKPKNKVVSHADATGSILGFRRSVLIAPLVRQRLRLRHCTSAGAVRPPRHDCNPSSLFHVGTTHSAPPPSSRLPRAIPQWHKAPSAPKAQSAWELSLFKCLLQGNGKSDLLASCTTYTDS